jgi:hypothetical protein
MFPKRIKPRSAKAKGTRLEHKAAKSLGGKRTPLSGAVGGGDISGTRFSVECKARATIPALIKNAFGQAERDINVGDTRTPLVIVQEDRGKAIACVYLDDFVKLLNDGGSENAWEVKQNLRAIAKLAKDTLSIA